VRLLSVADRYRRTLSCVHEHQLRPVEVGQWSADYTIGEREDVLDCTFNNGSAPSYQTVQLLCALAPRCSIATAK
jgi:hypothetical protein